MHPLAYPYEFNKFLHLGDWIVIRGNVSPCSYQIEFFPAGFGTQSTQRKHEGHDIVPFVAHSFSNKSIANK